jgi:hypothetical protein
MARIVSRAAGAFTTIAEVAKSVARKRHRRFLILMPVLLLIAVVIAVISSSGALAPFVYPLF